MASVIVRSPHCQSAQVYGHGQNPKGRDRFRCRELLALFTAFIIGIITSDGWGSYAREVLKDKGNTPTPAINTRPLS